MAKEILFYDTIFDETSKTFVQELEAARKERENIVIRFNTNGGDVSKGWGMISKFREFNFDKMVKIDGAASSMGFIFLLYADQSQAIEQSEFVAHRASSFFEMEPGVRRRIDKTNGHLRKAMEARLDIDRFLEIGSEQVGFDLDLDRFFDASLDPVDVVLDAFQAEEIGLVGEVTELSPTEIEAVNEILIAANAKPIEIKENLTVMTYEELKAKHPELFNQAKAEGRKEGEAAERDRISAWNEFVEVAPDEVKAGIASGEKPTLTQIVAFSKKVAQAELEAEATANADDDDQEDKTEKKGKKKGGDKKITAKSSAATTAKALEDDSPQAVDTASDDDDDDDEAQGTEKEKKVANFEKEVKAQLDKSKITV